MDRPKRSPAYEARFAWSRLTVCDGEAERRLLLAYAAKSTRHLLVNDIHEGWFAVPPHRQAFEQFRRASWIDDDLNVLDKYYLGRLCGATERPPSAEETKRLAADVRALYVRRLIQQRFDMAQELFARCEPLPEIQRALGDLSALIEEEHQGLVRQESQLVEPTANLQGA